MSSNFIGEKPVYSHVYAGHFKDKNQEINAAGILTYNQGDNVEKTIRMASISAPVAKLEPHIAKYTYYRAPDLGQIRLHYGHANDPKDYEQLIHGVHTDTKSVRAQDLLNPKPQNRFQHLKNDVSENMYLSKKSAPLGRVPIGNLPKSIDPYEVKFGRSSNICDSVKEIVNPNKSRSIVEVESSDKHDMYVISHKDYEPGEQKERKFVEPFSKMQRFGVKFNTMHDGRLAKESLNWLPTKLLDRRTQSESLLLDEFREKHTNQIGKPLDPNKETRFLGLDHIYGLDNNTDLFNAADIINSRSETRALKGKERERAFVSTARSGLARLNLVKFKTLVDAFKFYDKNKDSFITKDELKAGSILIGFPIADDLLDSLFSYCDYDKDGGINFLEFANFLCYKDSMKLGINEDLNIIANKDNQEIRDDEGRFLIFSSDLVHRNNIEVNPLVLRTLNNQIDEKVGNWKSTYDLINEAPFKHEPIIKRVYGVPTIRNDIAAPELKKIRDKTNYGNDGNAWSLLNPSIFSQHGVYESDVLKPRSKQEIQIIFKKIGFDLPADLFEKTWNTASSLNPYGEVSVEEFRSALSQLKIQKNSNYEVAVA